MGVVPAVRQVLDELQAEVVGLGRNGISVLATARYPWLVPYRLAARKRHRPRIAEAAHAAQAAEVVIERAVLLHQDHHVLDVFQGASAARGGYRERLLDRQWHDRRRERRTRRAE